MHYKHKSKGWEFSHISPLVLWMLYMNGFFFKKGSKERDTSLKEADWSQSSYREAVGLGSAGEAPCRSGIVVSRFLKTSLCMF